MTTKLNPRKPDGGETLFSKGYKYRDGGPVSDACGDNQHEKCTLDFTKCNCHYRGLHKTPHVYATAPSPQPSAEATPKLELQYTNARPAPSGETRGTRTFQQADCPKCKARITVEVLGLVKPLAPEATTKPGFYANPNTTLHDMFPLTTPPDPVAPEEAVGRPRLRYLANGEINDEGNCGCTSYEECVKKHQPEAVGREPRDIAIEIAENIFGLSVEAFHRRGPEWGVVEIANLIEPELSTLRWDRDQLREKNRDFNRRNQALTHAVNVQSERGRWHAYYLAAIGLFDDAENKNVELESQVRELTAQRDDALFKMNWADAANETWTNHCAQQADQVAELRAAVEKLERTLNTSHYPLTVSIDREVDGRWIAEVEAVPGALAYGETVMAAVANAMEIVRSK